MAHEEPNGSVESTPDDSPQDGQLAGTVKVTGEAASTLNQVASTDLNVTLQRSETQPTDDQALWVAIRNRTKAIEFNHYKDFIDKILCKETQPTENARVKNLQQKLALLSFEGSIATAAYDLLKLATETFLLLQCGVSIEKKDLSGENVLFKRQEEKTRLGNLDDVTFKNARERLLAYLQTYLTQTDSKTLPYLNRIVKAVFSDERLVTSPFCEGILKWAVNAESPDGEKFDFKHGPCLIELIWSYWLEEGGLVQTMKAISWRFQNRRRSGGRDPLAHLEIDPLRPLNNLLWGYIQDERSRLSLVRRAYEYDHHYGFTLLGKAIPKLQSADSRSKFLEGFHNLLYRSSSFYREDADTTVISDGFVLLNALKETHLTLAQGAHNQFGHLPWTARVEMLTEQWLLARPEIRDFLRGRAMVPYKEGWMSQVDTMKTLQGWTDTTITHFHNLALFGEDLMLSIRYADWIGIDDQEHAKNWARYWRPEVQGYIHAYRAVTGVDLASVPVESVPVDTTMPAIHLRKRLASQAKRPRR